MTKQIGDWYDMLNDQDRETADFYIIYCRRSYNRKKNSEEEYGSQVERRTPVDNISLEQQREACLHFAKKHGLKVHDEVFQETVSGIIPNKRAEFKRMLAYIKRNKDKKIGILSWSPDRLSRNALEAGVILQLFLEKKIHDFQFLTYHFDQTDVGLEYLMMEFARAMGYSLRLRKTVRRSMLSKYHKDGEWQFSIKFGYERSKVKDHKGLVGYQNFPIPHRLRLEERREQNFMSEYDATVMMFRLRLEGRTFLDIAKTINACGFQRKNGNINNLRKDDVRKVVLDTAYYGLWKSKFGILDVRKSENFRDDEGNRLHFIPAVIEEDFNKCQEVGHAKSKPKMTVHKDLPFRSIIKCGACDSAIIPQKKKGNAYYYCMNSQCEGSKRHAQSGQRTVNAGITGVKLFEAIGELLKEDFKPTQRELTAYLLSIEQENHLIKEVRKNDWQTIQNQRAALLRRIDTETSELKSFLADKNISDSMRTVAIAASNKEVARLEGEIKNLSKREQAILSHNRAWVQDIQEWLELTSQTYKFWEMADFAQKTDLAKKLFLELTILDGKIVDYRYNRVFSNLGKTKKVKNGGPYRT